MMDYTSKDWWKSLPCHLCPEWNLRGNINLDVRKLKQHVDWSLEDDPDFMPIEHLLYRAFLEVPPEGYLMKRRSSPETALKFLERADDLLARITEDDGFTRNSYKLVINAFRMWLYSDGNFRETSKIDDLNGTLASLHLSLAGKPTPHIDVVRATALKRLGFDRYDEAIFLLERAMKNAPAHGGSKEQWLFCKAVLIGRKARSEQKSARGNISDDERKEMFDQEMTLFQQLVNANPSFARARAYLGRSLYNLNEKPTGVEELREAHRRSPGNRKISVMYGKVLRWYKRFGESERILTKVKDWKDSEEVLYQLALIYQKMGKDKYARRRMEYNKTALNYVDQAVILDTNHVPALCTQAELAVALGDREKARRLYFDLLRGMDISPEQLYYLRCCLNKKPALMRIFDSNERLLNAYNILLLCTKHFVEASSNAKKRFRKSHTLGTDEALDVIELEIYNQSDLRLDAMRFLADVMFKLGDFRTAEKVLNELQKIEGREHISQVLWQLGNSLCALGYDVTAEEVAKQLQASTTNIADHTQCRELFADIHLMRVKSSLETHSSSLFADHQENDIVENLRLAIDYGSIEACYVFLTKFRDLPQHVCRDKSNVAGILASIRQCIERGDNVHLEFARRGQSSNDTPASRVLEDLMRSILTLRKNTDGLPRLLRTRHEAMTNIRVDFIDFEHTFRYCCGGEWDRTCQEKAEKILTDVRNLLDHIIYSHQRAVMDKRPMQTIFPIHNKDTKGKSVEEKLNGYLDKYFSKAEPPVPDDIKGYLMAIQPMTNPENNWLNALCFFVNNAKHTGSDDGDTKVHYEDKLGQPIKYEKVELVRISCCRVESIAVKLLDYLEALHTEGKTKPGFSA